MSEKIDFTEAFKALDELPGLRGDIIYTSDPHLFVDVLIALGSDEDREHARKMLLGRLVHLLKIQGVVKEVNEACREACRYLVGDPPPVTIELEHPLKWLNLDLGGPR